MVGISGFENRGKNMTLYELLRIPGTFLEKRSLCLENVSALLNRQ